jgi:hypothetical protein
MNINNKEIEIDAEGYLVHPESLSPARTRFKEITNWAKIGFC